MSVKKSVGLLGLAMVSMLSLNSFAQGNEKKFGFELCPGASFPTRNLYDAELKTGYGFEGMFHYWFLPHTGVYAGWGWNKIAADESFAGNNMDFEETGYIFGVQYRHLLGNSSTSFFVRAGGLYNHIEIEDKDGNITEDTGHGFGWQVAGGLDIPLGRNWSLTPGIKFNALSRDLVIEGTSKQLILNYVSVRAGITKKF